MRNPEYHINVQENCQTGILNIFDKTSFLVSLNIQKLLNAFPYTLTALDTDILRIVAAIHGADRALPPRPQYGRRIITLTMPVKEYFRLCSIRRKMEAILNWLTHDEWSLCFQQIQGKQYPQAEQFDFSSVGEGERLSNVALWSGGLDALTGAYSYIAAHQNEGLCLVGSGCNREVFSLQKKVADDMRRHFHKRVQYCDIPLFVEKGRIKNKCARSRGLLFATVGLIFGRHCKSNKLLVFENGIGAFNIPMTGQNFDEMSHSVHPVPLQMLSELFSELYELMHPIENPCLFHTKSQMCQEALSLGCTEELLLKTQTCDSIGREKGMPQCGVCSSCLIRRISLFQSIGKDDGTYGHQTKDREAGIKRFRTWAFRTQEEIQIGSYPPQTDEVFSEYIQLQKEGNIHLIAELVSQFCQEVIESLPFIEKKEQLHLQPIS